MERQTVKPRAPRAPAGGAAAKNTAARAASNAAKSAPRPAAKRSPAPGAPAGPGRGPKKPVKKQAGSLAAILKTAKTYALKAWKAVKKAARAFWHLFDRYRTDEVRTVIVNAGICGAILAVILAVFFLTLPARRVRGAVRTAASGDVAGFEQLLTAFRSDGYSSGRLEEARCDAARALLKKNEPQKALAVLAPAQETQEVLELRDRCRYASADALYRAGSYGAAMDLFYSLGSFSDSASRYADCRVAAAISAWLSGDTSKASGISDIADLETRVERVANDVAGDRDTASRILSSPEFDPTRLREIREKRESLLSAQKAVSHGHIAAGLMHTVALAGDGTLRSAGSNEYGQCSVAGWSGVTFVAAGSYHTLGLRADGTVLACGDNTYGQCDVAGWTDVTAVAAGAFDSYGLRSDGTVVSCGMHKNNAQNFRDVSAIRAGSYSCCALLRSGTFVVSHPGAKLDVNDVVTDYDSCGSVTCAVFADGHVASNYPGLPAWEQIVSVSVSPTGIIGIDADGNARIYDYRDGERTVTGIGRVLEAISSGTHTVFLTADGRLYAYGNAVYGQCDVNGITLN